MATDHTVNHTTLTRQQINDALRANCLYWGSHKYYLEDEIRIAEEHPEILVVFQRPGEAMRAYTQRHLLR